MTTFLDSWLEYFKPFQMDNIITAVSTAISLMALAVAIRAQRANYRLAARVANEAGRLHSARISGVKKDGRSYITLQAVNGPTEITITTLLLKASYHCAPPTLFRRGDTFEFCVHNEHAIREFEMVGPELDLRLAPHGRGVWTMPSRCELIGEDDHAEYRVGFYTARGDYVESSPYACGTTHGIFPIPWGRSKHYHFNSTSLLDHMNPEFPKELWKWVKNDHRDG